jgi:hypothetical protein
MSLLNEVISVPDLESAISRFEAFEKPDMSTEDKRDYVFCAAEIYSFSKDLDEKPYPGLVFGETARIMEDTAQSWLRSSRFECVASDVIERFSKDVILEQISRYSGEIIELCEITDLVNIAARVDIHLGLDVYSLVTDEPLQSEIYGTLIPLHKPLALAAVFDATKSLVTSLGGIDADVYDKDLLINGMSAMYSTVEAVMQNHIFDFEQLDAIKDVFNIYKTFIATIERIGLNNKIDSFLDSFSHTTGEEESEETLESIYAFDSETNQLQIIPIGIDVEELEAARLDLFKHKLFNLMDLLKQYNIS